MKTLKTISMAIAAVMFSLGLSSCSGSSTSSALTGKTFKIAAWNDDSYVDLLNGGVASVENTLTFNSDGTVTQSNTIFEYCKYTVDGDKLTIITGDEQPEECMVGTIKTSPNAAGGITVTFAYNWQDYGEEPDEEDDEDMPELDEEDNDFYTLILEQQ